MAPSSTRPSRPRAARHRYRRALGALALAFGVLTGPTAALPVGAAPSAPADHDLDEPASTTSVPPTPDIIPKPNQGVAPQDAGDRGGALQTALFVGILAGVGGIGAWVWRQSRRVRVERGY